MLPLAVTRVMQTGGNIDEGGETVSDSAPHSSEELRSSVIIHQLQAVKDFDFFDDWRWDEGGRNHSFGRQTIAFGPNGSGKSSLDASLPRSNALKLTPAPSTPGSRAFRLLYLILAQDRSEPSEGMT